MAASGKSVKLALSGASYFKIGQYVSMNLSGNLTIQGSGSTVLAMFYLRGANAMLTMNGGVTLSGNTGSSSGCVCVNGDSGSHAIFVMNGGTITGNKVTTSTAGGGVTLNQNAEFVMNGGSIYSNTGNNYCQLYLTGEAGGNYCRAFWGQGVTGHIDRGYAGETANTLYAEPFGANPPATTTYTGTGGGTGTVPGDTDPTTNPYVSLTSGMQDTGLKDAHNNTIWGLDMYKTGGEGASWSSGQYVINEGIYASK
jgi:formylmethanofuran dehydrogenase subunit C